MELAKKNRSAIRSQRLLTEAFFELLRENPHKRIQIKALCERAGVVRATFYAHYQAIEDIPYAYYIDDWVEKLNLLVDENLENGLSAVGIYPLGAEFILDYWGKEVEVFRLLKAAGMENIIQKIFYVGVKENLDKFVKEISLSVDPLLLDYYVTQNITTLFLTYDFWVATGMEKSAREMAEIMIKFASFSLLEELVEQFADSNKED